MARRAQSRTCVVCGDTGLYWKEVQGPRGLSIRLVNPLTGEIHPSKTCNEKREQKNQAALDRKEYEYPPIQNQFENRPRIEIPSPIESHIIEPEISPADEVSEIDGQNGQIGTPELYKLIRPNVEREIEERLRGFEEKFEGHRTISHEVVVKNEIGEIQTKIEGCHRLFADLLKRVSLRMNVLLVGPAGSGKTHAAHQCAEVLGLDYYPMSVGPQTSKSDLIGYMDATGRLVRTVLREAYENGGVFLLDEMDAGNAGVLTVLNALLANSVCSFPDGVIRKHDDFICIAAANTFGQGANRQYVGRQQLDAATLDRFVGMEWDYDTDLEEKFSASQPDWCLYVWGLRKSAESLGIKRVFGTRRIQQGVKMLDAGISLAEVKDQTVFFGVPSDERAKLERGIQ